MIDSVIRHRFPERGRVSCGIKVPTPNGKTRPQAVDYFVCSDQTLFESVLGEAAPKFLPIVLPYERADDVWSTSFEWWKGSVLACASQDGKTAKRKCSPSGWQFDVSAEPTPVACPARACDDLREKRCKPVGRLSFFLDGDENQDGVLRLVTNSWQTIEAISARIALFRQTPLAGVKAELVVVWEREGKKEFPVVHLQVRARPAPHGQPPAEPVSPAAADQGEAALRAEVIRLAREAGVDPKYPVFVEWVKENGYEQAIAKMKARAARQAAAG